MLQSQKSWCWKLELVTYLAISGAIIALLDNCTLAQSNIVPDSTLDAESSRVNSLNSDSPADEIQGGAIHGNNLFHSFQEFNVGKGRGAYFLSPNADIQNILARVTGGNVSEILGTLGTRGGSSPNLFLINHNGIIFGSDARLDVGGSFVASTASSLKFSDGTEFSTTEPHESPLLTVSVPLGLQFRTGGGKIVNQSVAVDSRGLPVGLQVQPGKTLALVGGDMMLENGNLTAEPGRIELGSVAGSSLVSLIPNSQGWFLGYEGVQNFQDIHLSQASAVYAIGEGSNIQVQGRRITLTNGSQILSATVGSQAGGNVVVNAADSLEVAGFTTTPYARIPSGLRTDTEGSGTAGNLTINTSQLIVKDGAVVSAGTSGEGQGGRLTVTASDSVELSGAAITPDTQFPSGLFTQTQSSGDAGNLIVDTGKLVIKDGAVVSASTLVGSTGQGGRLTVTASDSVELSGAAITPDTQFPSGLFTQTQSSGDAGNLIVDTGKLVIKDGAVVSASTLVGSTGQGGRLTVTASDSVELSGTTADGEITSGLFAQTQGSGDAGNLIVDTRKLVVEDRAVVSAGTSTGSTGRGGNLTVTASDSVELSGTSTDGEITSGLFARTRGTGPAGNLTVTTDQLIVRDQAQVTVSGVESGEAGNLDVTAGSIRLENQGAILAETASAQGGNITLRSQDLLLMRNNSLISTTAGTAGAGGNGGNIDIDADLLVAVPQENSDIIARAFQGNGGNINIETRGIFGFQYRDRPTPRTSDITASSEFGVDGTVDINTPDIAPSQGLVSLPTVPVDAEVAQACAPGGSQAQSEFVVTGRGGLPPNPTEALSSDAIQVDWVTLNPKEDNRASPLPATNPTSPAPDPIVEAQGWVTGNHGEVILTASTPASIHRIGKAQLC